MIEKLIELKHYYCSLTPDLQPLFGSRGYEILQQWKGKNKIKIEEKIILGSLTRYSTFSRWKTFNLCLSCMLKLASHLNDKSKSIIINNIK